MATKRKGKRSRVARDARNELEAVLTDPSIRTADAELTSVTSQPISLGDEIGLLETAQTAPNGAVNWYVNGTPGAQVSIAIERVSGSGGHNHGGNTSDPNAVGQIAPNSFTLPSPYPQNVRCVYRATSVCGSNKLTFRFSAGSPPTIDNFVEVLISGLQPIPSSSSLQLKAPLSEHPSPYWGHPSFIAKLVQLANAYFQERNKPITVTDSTLMWGGRFDLKQNWAPPHAEHMDGRQADLRSRDMNEADKKAFLRIAAQVGIQVLEEGDHWHVRG